MVEKGEFYCPKAASQKPETRGEIDENFCLEHCNDPQRGVKAQCPEVVKGTPKPRDKK